MSDINVGAITEALNDKMDRDAHNVQFPSDAVVDSQLPTSDNGYTWYYKFASGFVMQGGWKQKTGGAQTLHSATLPIPMSDVSYQAFASYCGGAGDSTTNICLALTTTTLNMYPVWSTTGQWMCWAVFGMSAS